MLLNAQSTAKVISGRHERKERIQIKTIIIKKQLERNEDRRTETKKQTTEDRTKEEKRRKQTKVRNSGGNGGAKEGN